MSHLVRVSAVVVVGTVAVGGSALVIPLTPILIGIGLIGATAVAVTSIKSSKKRNARIRANEKGKPLEPRGK
jgi:uncharacterized membrane protein YphA (DoxX/SURF4 family)